MSYLVLDGSGIIQSSMGSMPSILVIPDTCTGIQDSLFNSNLNLLDVTIPATFTTPTLFRRRPLD